MPEEEEAMLDDKVSLEVSLEVLTGVSCPCRASEALIDPVLLTSILDTLAT